MHALCDFMLRSFSKQIKDGRNDAIKNRLEWLLTHACDMCCSQR